MLPLFIASMMEDGFLSFLHSHAASPVDASLHQLPLLCCHPAISLVCLFSWSWPSRVQAAALSGRALAERISAMRGLAPAEAAHLAAGLTEPLGPVGGAAFGQFPGAELGDSVVQQKEQQGGRARAQGQRARRQPVQAR
jgi:hypothetical protein